MKQNLINYTLPMLKTRPLLKTKNSEICIQQSQLFKPQQLHIAVPRVITEQPDGI